MSMSDVSKYSKVLDETLLEFHSQKMEDINKTIQQLWDHIYFGKDIDGIEIKAEPAATGRASYNYRVVMRKDGIDFICKFLGRQRYNSKFWVLNLII